ncbi:choline/carnitine O-acyltransferase [Kocuria sp. CH-021]|uniref:choline/carnitine O-acyltransferase n=1 Tax=Kocuria sp. CH-021 TaxID=3406735 RepID=UPI003C727FCA
MEELSERTFGNEEQLPRLPLPRLEDSAERFLAWCAPLLSAAELARTESAVSSFLAPDSPARDLQRELEERAAGDAVPSWLDRFWTHRYLSVRGRIAPDENFVVLFEDSGQGQVERASSIVRAAVDYKLRLDREEILPALLRGRPLSMEQQKYLFATTRVPGLEVDTIRAPYTPQQPGPSSSRHVAVLCRGQAFRLDVLDEQGHPYAPGAVEAGLREVLAAASDPAARSTSVGPFTTLPRTQWAEHRRALLDRSADNAASLEAVESALLCVVLDEAAPADEREAGDLLLHGNSADRWFDRSLTVVVFADGRAGASVEHSCLDGTTVLAFVDAVLEEAGEPAGPGQPSAAVPAAEPLAFDLDDRLQDAVREAAASFAAQGAAIATAVASVDELGARRIKELGVSPDAFVQLAFQLAHQRVRGHLGSTYEPIATRQYRLGRTETMRVVTPEAARLVAAMDDPGADPTARQAAFRAAAAAHTARARGCQAGSGPERHLWTLQQLQRERGEDGGEWLALYRSPGWHVLRDDCLSTSSTPAQHIRFCAFAPTGPRCIGIAYMVLPERLGLHLSAPRARAGELAEFVDRLRDAVVELRDLLAAESGGDRQGS